MARHNLGYAHYLQGDLVLAMDQMEVARQVLDGISPVVKAIGGPGPGGGPHRGRAGQPRASKALREASRTYAVRQLHQRRLEAQARAGPHPRSTDPDAALAAARLARRLFIRTDSAAWLVRADGDRAGPPRWSSVAPVTR